MYLLSMSTISQATIPIAVLYYTLIAMFLWSRKIVIPHMMPLLRIRTNGIERLKLSLVEGVITIFIVMSWLMNMK